MMLEKEALNWKRNEIHLILWTLSMVILFAACSTSKALTPQKSDQFMHKKAYTLFDKNGSEVNYGSLIDKSLVSEIILFGELHNNPICHWLQIELTKNMAAKKFITLGLEMIERDNQTHLDSYLSGQLDTEGLDSTARLWGNYNTDYKPLIDFAKDKQLVVVASNVPRRYAKMVYRNGFEILDSLPDSEKTWIAPLPLEYDPTLPGYVKMLEMAGGHGGENFPKAQAIKDATMAHSILSYLEEGKTFIHFHGSFHSDHYEGILWYLQRKKPDATYLTISSVEQDQIDNLEKEHLGKADFILCIPSSMTKTY